MKVKRNKLILLTILMVLVLYCGAVIFVTKPNSFAYSAIFGDNGQRTTVMSAPKATPAAESIDADAIIKDAVDAATKQAETIAKDAAEQSGESIRKAIEDSLPALVDEAVKKAMAEYDVSEQVAKKVTDDILSQKDEFAAVIYDGYKDAFVDEVAKEVVDRLAYSEPVKSEEIEPEPEVVSEPEAPAVITPEEYEAQRQEIRNSEISSLLEKLGE